MATFGSFGQTQPNISGGAMFGSGAASTAAKPIGIGTTQASTTTSGGLLGGLLAGTPSTTSTTGGFSLGGLASKPTTSFSTGFSLGGTPASTAATTTTGGLGGFGGFGTPASTAATTAATSTGFGGFGGTATAATSTGFGGFGSTSLGTTTSSGLTLGATSTGSTLGGSFSLGGLGSTTSTATGLSRGLGGINPASSSVGGSSNASKPGTAGDAKASSKETQIPAQLAVTVDEFQKYVKEQKCVRENIARMSCKNLYKVQEEVAALKQALSLVCNDMQRNAGTIGKLKLQAAQELKYAEIAQRTKDTPPGLQYENTAPTEYFQYMVVAFEQQMVTYRQQIEQMETYLSSLNHNAILTPHELSLVLNKLLSSFISLAAQLQSVHEHVHGQKEHYLNYRKVFHGDSMDVFEKRRAGDKPNKVIKASTMPPNFNIGPTPFQMTSSPAALAMAAAASKTGQQPQGPQGGQGAAGSSLSFNMGGGSNAGGGLFAPATTQAKTITGFSMSSCMGGGVGFGSTASTGGFGLTATQPTATVRPLGAVSTEGQQTPGGTFQLQKPPIGNKRNKKD